MKIRSVSRHAAYIAGMLDVCVAFSYIGSVPVQYVYAVTLALKVLAIALFGSPGLRNLLFHAPFLVVLLLISSLSILANELDIANLIELAAFILHLSLTISLVSKERLFDYLRIVAINGTILSIIYILFWQTGNLQTHFGRHMYFGDSHPNLGSEIFAVTTTAAVLTYSPRFFFASAALATFCVFLMQGRAALIVLIVLIAYRMILIIRSFEKRNVYLVATTALAAISGTCIIFISELQTFFSELFLTNDEHRGAESGLVGREDRWMDAYERFTSNPFLGVGFGFHRSTEIESPHNLYLYGLSEFGITFIPIALYLGFLLYRSIKSNHGKLLPLLALIILTIFNDRFINLNPYPFIFFIIIFIGQFKVYNSKHQI